MLRSNGRWGKVVTFVLLAFIISTVFYIIMYVSGSARDIGALWMWSPAAGAFLTQWLFRENIRSLGWGPGRKKHLLYREIHK